MCSTNPKQYPNIQMLIFPAQEPYEMEYAIACPPSQHLTNSGCNITIIAIGSPADVTISTAGGDQEFVVEPKEPITLTVSSSLLPDEGVEPKGILIQSESNVQVIVHKLHVTSEDWAIDTFQPYSRHRSQDKKYYTMSALNEDGRQCDTFNHFLSVTAFEDDTEILVKQVDDEAMHFTLDIFDELTLKNNDANDDFVSGTYVESNKPVSVTSGNVCGSYTPDTSSGGGASIVSSVPSLDQYGPDFIAVPITGPLATGYFLRVVAAENDTVVTIDQDTDIELDQGDIFTIDRPFFGNITHVICSKDCYVWQIAYSTTGTMGAFMMGLNSMDQFYNASDFTTMDYHHPHHVTIVVDGIPPMDDIYLDGASLEDADWQRVGNVSFAYVDVSRGFHQMRSETKEFAIYVYGHTFSRSGGYGYNVMVERI